MGCWMLKTIPSLKKIHVNYGPQALTNLTYSIYSFYILHDAL